MDERGGKKDLDEERLKIKRISEKEFEEIERR